MSESTHPSASSPYPASPARTRSSSPPPSTTPPSTRSAPTTPVPTRSATTSARTTPVPSRSGSDRLNDRRAVSILPWASDDPGSRWRARPRGGGEPARPASATPRRAPVPPSGLVSAPAPGNRTRKQDPLASLPPWLPPVRRADRTLGPRPRPSRPASHPTRPQRPESAQPPEPGRSPEPWRSPAQRPPSSSPVPNSPITTAGRPRPPAGTRGRSPLTESAPGPPLAEEPKRRLTADAISHDQVVTPEGSIPTVGWRAAVYSATSGRINLGIGASERDWLELLNRVRRPIAGTRQLAVASIKGGVGKTTVAACLGLTLAEYRGDGVVAVDADPDAGTLADRLTGEPTVTVRDLLANLEQIRSLSQLGAYTSLAGRLRVLAGEQDPAVGEAFRGEEYQRVCRALTRFFDIVITDSGTGLVHSTMRGTLELVDRLIVVGTPTVDGASRASKTLDWLLAHGHERLAERAVLVLCQDRNSHRVDRRKLFAHFTERCQHVVEIPADPHLYSGGVIDPSRLRPETREAYLRLAAVVADGFTEPI